MNVLVVDDDPLTCKMLRFLLMDEGHTVRTALSAESASTIVGQEQIDLLLLDVVLPRADGFQLYRQLREGGYEMPVIYLTACTDLNDKVAGLLMGAEDYVVKPFEPAELVARVKAVLRRAYQSRLASQPVRVRAGGIMLDVGDLRVRLPGQKVVYLTRSEMRVLQVLMSNAGAIVPRGVLAEALWGRDNAVATDRLNVYVRRLRQKIEPEPDRPRYIESIRSLGYRFRPLDTVVAGWAGA